MLICSLAMFISAFAGAANKKSGVKDESHKYTDLAFPKNIDTWKGDFIWYPEEKIKKTTEYMPSPTDFATRFFKKKFYLDKADIGADLKLQIFAHTKYELWINGKKTGTGRYSSGKPDVYAISNLVHEGENDISVKVEHHTSIYFLVAEITKSAPVNKYILVSDKNWKTTSTFFENWTDFKFDAKDWKDSEALPKSENEKLRKSIPYITTLRDNEIKIEKIAIDDRTYRPGDTVTGKIILRSIDANGSYNVFLRLANDTMDIDWISDRIVSNYEIAHHKILNVNLKKDGVLELPFSFVLPEFIPNGTVPLRIYFLYGNDKSVATLAGAVNNNTIAFLKLLNNKKPFHFTQKPKAPQATLKTDKGNTLINIDGKDMSPVIFTNLSRGYERFYREAETGVKIFRLSHYRNRMLPGKAENPAEYYRRYFECFDEQVRRFLSVNPDCYIIFLGILDPTSQWEKEHPDTQAVMADGIRYRFTLGSEEFINGAKEAVSTLVRNIESQPYSDRVIGYCFGVGKSCEMIDYLAYQNRARKTGDYIIGDYSPARCEAFRKWTQEKYQGNIDSLRKAWNIPDMTFENIKPLKELLNPKNHNSFFFNPEKYQHRSDYFQNQAEQAVKLMNDVGEAAKKSSKGNILIGYYYGYTLHMGIHRVGGTQQNGHSGLYKALRSENIDFFVVPHFYGYRKPGDGIHVTIPGNSVNLHNKLLIDENDQRTPISHSMHFAGFQPENIGQVREVLWRDAAYYLTHNIGSWWFDMGMNNEKPWFTYDNELLQEIKNMSSVLKIKDTGFAFNSPSEIAIIVNESVSADIQIDLITAYLNLLRVTYNNFFKSGAPFDIYLQGDLKNIPWKKYKAVFFLNSFGFNDDERNFIKNKVAKNNRFLIWNYAPGYIDTGKTLSLETMKDVSGFNFKEIDIEDTPDILIENENTFLTKGMKAGTRIKMTTTSRLSKFSPLFATQDGERAGRHISCDETALAVKKFPDWTSIYIGAFLIPPEIIKNIIRKAGVFIYNDNNITGFYGNHFTGFTADKKTDFRCNFPSPLCVYDIRGKKLLGKNTDKVDLSMEDGETLILFIGNENELDEFLKL